MGIELYHVKHHDKGEMDLIEPHIHCDVCHGIIDKDNHGNIIWTRDDFEGYNNPLPIRFVHSRCDIPRYKTNWVPIDKTLIQLFNNTFDTQINPDSFLKE